MRAFLRTLYRMLARSAREQAAVLPSNSAEGPGERRYEEAKDYAADERGERVVVSKTIRW